MAGVLTALAGAHGLVQALRRHEASRPRTRSSRNSLRASVGARRAADAAVVWRGFRGGGAGLRPDGLLTPSATCAASLSWRRRRADSRRGRVHGRLRRGGVDGSYQILRGRWSAAGGATGGRSVRRSRGRSLAASRSRSRARRGCKRRRSRRRGTLVVNIVCAGLGAGVGLEGCFHSQLCSAFCSQWCLSARLGT